MYKVTEKDIRVLLKACQAMNNGQFKKADELFNNSALDKFWHHDSDLIQAFWNISIFNERIVEAFIEV
jgi:hypothetical protein